MDDANPLATTPGGLPYPLPTDPLTDGANAIKNLALAVEAKLPAPIWDSVAAGAALGTPNLVSPALPATYRNLRIRGTLVSNIANNGGTLIRINGDAATTRYFGTLSQFRGGQAASFNEAGSGVAGLNLGNVGTIGDGFDILIPNYADVIAGIVKTILSRKAYNSGAGSGLIYDQQCAGIWNLAATAVSTVGLHCAGAANWVAGTRILIYGE